MRTSVLASLVLITCCLYTSVLFAQFSKTLSSNQMGTFPLQGRSSFNQLSGPGEQMKQGATAEDILRQVNPNNPGYGMDPARNQQATIAMIQSRMANDPAYNLRGIRANRLPFNKQLELHQLI